MCAAQQQNFVVLPFSGSVAAQKTLEKLVKKRVGNIIITFVVPITNGILIEARERGRNVD